MESFIIKGNVPLYGSVRLGGAKNASFKIMIASLLADSESRLLNLAHIDDVAITRQILESLGAQVRPVGERTLYINPATTKNYQIPGEFGSQSRASSMFIGPLLHRFGQTTFPIPGGDKVGRRPIERHLEGLRTMGARVDFQNGFYHLQCQKLKGTRYRFSKTTHTGTENLIMAAVKAQGKTILENAALEPEIDDLISFLNKTGAKIKRKANRTIEIEGVKKLKGTIHSVMPDRNEAVTYACAALATKGDIVVENAQKEHLKAFLKKVNEIGGGYQIGDFGIRFYFQKPLKPSKVVTQPHPGFMTDWQPLWAVLMTQAKGVSTIHEAVHSYRFHFVPDLIKMGAKIASFNPIIKNPEEFYNFNLTDERKEDKHALKITGPTKLKAQKFTVHDLRAGATLVLAALISKGETTIENIGLIDRGYEDLDQRLLALGAWIKRV